jgi:hypothetical protein
VPPQWKKEILGEHDLYRGTWQKARVALEGSKCLMLLGYSCPPTDLLAQTLLRCRNRPVGKTTGRNYLKLLIIANPDVRVRRRLMKSLRNSIDEKTRVMVFDTLEELTKFLVPKKKHIRKKPAATAR